MRYLLPLFALAFALPSAFAQRLPEPFSHTYYLTGRHTQGQMRLVYAPGTPRERMLTLPDSVGLRVWVHPLGVRYDTLAVEVLGLKPTKLPDIGRPYNSQAYKAKHLGRAEAVDLQPVFELPADELYLVLSPRDSVHQPVPVGVLTRQNWGLGLLSVPLMAQSAAGVPGGAVQPMVALHGFKRLGVTEYSASGHIRDYAVGFGAFAGLALERIDSADVVLSSTDTITTMGQRLLTDTPFYVPSLQLGATLFFQKGDWQIGLAGGVRYVANATVRRTWRFAEQPFFGVMIGFAS